MLVRIHRGKARGHCSMAYPSVNAASRCQSWATGGWSIIPIMRGLQDRLWRIIVVSWIGAGIGSVGIWALAKQLEMPWWAVGGLLGALIGGFWGLSGWRWSRPVHTESSPSVNQFSVPPRRKRNPLKAVWRWLRRTWSAITSRLKSLLRVVGDRAFVWRLFRREKNRRHVEDQDS